ncbi:cystathionine gamma-synthase family protein [Catenovulum agarivorans]|uniref:cystathionine gamma-synthase family protein n=1 Tax=Catenovulum agarivorans TaxID=1172192 RepID=UPI0002E97724|nr:cystathionine gamma-synthase family protein [Catenovulum agarivorans]
MTKAKGFTTKLVHAERQQKPHAGAIHFPVDHSVLFAYEKADDLIDVFQGRSSQHAYARQSSPSISSLQNTISYLEGGHASLVFSSGMAALTTLMLTLLKAGDHVIFSRFVFGNTNSFADTLSNLGIEISLVDITNIEEVQSSIKPNSRLLFCETIANPMTQVADINALGNLCSRHNLLFTVDNTMTPSYLLDAANYPIDLLITSLTKYFGGHANALGGAIIDMGKFDWRNFPNILPTYQKNAPQDWGLTQVKKKGLRDMGACLSADSAHLLAVGSETMALRLERSCKNAHTLANYLNNHEKIKSVFYPGLTDHPQHQLASIQFTHFGAILSFAPIDDIDCIKVIDAFELILCSTHLGDNRTLAIPVAQTIYYEMGKEKRAAMGISENMIRLSVGIEDIDDLIEDLAQALNKLD